MFEDREKKEKYDVGNVFQVQFLTLGAMVVTCLGPVSSDRFVICDMDMGGLPLYSFPEGYHEITLEVC